MRTIIKTNQAKTTTGKPEVDASVSIGVAEPTVLTTALLKEFTPAQRELVRICELMVQQLGLPMSLGSIFGVIYSSPTPLAFKDVVEMSGISRGSVSHGLRLLCEIEAIKEVRVSGERVCRYAPEPELRRVLMRMLQTRLRAPLEQGAERLRAFKASLCGTEDPNRDFYFQRLTVLQAWHCKALRALPLVERTFEENRA